MRKFKALSSSSPRHLGSDSDSYMRAQRLNIWPRPIVALFCPEHQTTLLGGFQKQAGNENLNPMPTGVRQARIL